MGDFSLPWEIIYARDIFFFLGIFFPTMDDFFLPWEFFPTMGDFLSEGYFFYLGRLFPSMGDFSPTMIEEIKVKFNEARELNLKEVSSDMSKEVSSTTDTVARSASRWEARA